LVGKTLFQICIGEHDLIFNFDEPVSISITSSIGLTLPESKEQTWEDFRQGIGFLVALLSQSVSSVSSSTDGTVILKFREGGVLKLYDSNKQYESYRIKGGNKPIVA